MKNIKLLVALAVVVVGLALATGVAYAAMVVDGTMGYGQDAAPQTNDGTIIVYGFVTEITTDTLVLSDTVIAINDATVFVDEVVVGDKVRVLAYYDEADVLTALKVSVCDSDGDREYVKITGEVTDITTSTLTISDTVIAIVTDTVIIGTVDVGDYVNVKAYFAEDGSLIATLIVQIRGCWDGEMGEKGDDGACQHGDERTPPGDGKAYQGDKEDAGNPDMGQGNAEDNTHEHGNYKKSR